MAPLVGVDLKCLSNCKPNVENLADNLVNATMMKVNATMMKVLVNSC